MNRALLSLLLFLGLTALPASAQITRQQLTMDSPFVSEIYAFLIEDEVITPPACSTLFTGSSSIRFWFTAKEDFPTKTVVRRGFGGAHIEHVNMYFDLIIAPHSPQEVVFYAGENDLNAGKSPEAVLADFQTFMGLAEKQFGTIPVYYIAIKPSIARFAEFEAQTAANRLLKDYAESKENLTFVDIVSPMLEGGKPKDIFISDQLHMGLDGYAIWQKILAPTLETSPTCTP